MRPSPASLFNDMVFNIVDHVKFCLFSKTSTFLKFTLILAVKCNQNDNYAKSQAMIAVRAV